MKRAILFLVLFCAVGSLCSCCRAKQGSEGIQIRFPNFSSRGPEALSYEPYSLFPFNNDKSSEVSKSGFTFFAGAITRNNEETISFAEENVFVSYFSEGKAISYSFVGGVDFLSSFRAKVYNVKGDTVFGPVPAMISAFEGGSAMCLDCRDEDNCFVTFLNSDFVFFTRAKAKAPVSILDPSFIMSFLPITRFCTITIASASIQIDGVETEIIVENRRLLGGFFVNIADTNTWVNLDSNDNATCKFEADDVFDVREGVAPFVRNGKWGFVSNTGTVLIQPIYKHVGYFNEGVASAITEENERLFIRKDGTIALRLGINKRNLSSHLPNTVETCCEGLIPNYVEINDGMKWGFINLKGEVIIPYQYDYAFPFHEGIATVLKKR